jgi:hypothetical protein
MAFLLLVDRARGSDESRHALLLKYFPRNFVAGGVLAAALIRTSRDRDYSRTYPRSRLGMRHLKFH